VWSSAVTFAAPVNTDHAPESHRNGTPPASYSANRRIATPERPSTA